MTRRLVAALAVLLAVAPAIGAPAGKKPGNVESVRHDLEQLERDIGKANIERDRAFFDRVEAEECLFTDSAGGLTTKKEDLDSLNVPPNPDVKLLTYDVDEMKVALFGETAVVTGRITTKRMVKEKEIAGASRFTDVFVWRQARWQLVAGHSSRIKQP